MSTMEAEEKADPHADDYEYTLSQFLMMKRMRYPWSDWSDVTDYVRRWLSRREEDIDIEVKRTYRQWEALYPPSEL